MHVTFDGIPDEDRADALRDRLAGGAVPLAVSYRGAPTVDAVLDADTFGDGMNTLDVSIRSSWLELRHTRAVSDASAGHLILVLASSGSSSFEQSGWQLRARPGEMFLATTEFPLSAAAAGSRTWMALTIPHDEVRLPRSMVRDAIGRPLGAGHPVAPTLARYLRDLPLDGSSPAALRALRDPTVALVRALVAATVGDEFRLREPLRDSLFERAMASIHLNALVPDLTPELIADSLGISTRYLYRILSRRDVSLSETVRALRLAEAQRLLRSTTLTVSAVAYSVGFADHAHFTRTFHRVYGVTPSAWRADGATSSRE
ncbi:helix-turn-helix transcriptional regulator [Leifsonia sp. NPDC077715]|uniref:helix-turn-helix transcriptional regulator n=1 Tax=Leifsonia sp. NPDC077715 TaxID=3155539 RepID=UPI003425E7EA